MSVTELLSSPPPSQNSTSSSISFSCTACTTDRQVAHIKNPRYPLKASPYPFKMHLETDLCGSSPPTSPNSQQLSPLREHSKSHLFLVSSLSVLHVAAMQSMQVCIRSFHYPTRNSPVASITLRINHRLFSMANKVIRELHWPISPRLLPSLHDTHTTNTGLLSLSASEHRHLFFLQLEIIVPPPPHSHYFWATAFSFFVAFNTT